MILLAFLIMVIAIIAAGATQIWLIAFIGIGLFVGTILMYFMSVNDIFGNIMILLSAIAVPALFIYFRQAWILYVGYIAIGLWINAGSITDSDVYTEWTFEGKIYLFWEERATDFVIHLNSLITAAVWAGFAWLSLQFSWFFFLPPLYLIVRSIIVFIKANDYYLTHTFNLGSDIKNFFKSAKRGFKKFFKGDGSSRRKFSWWNFLVCILLLGVSITLTIIEKEHIYSNFCKSITDIFSDPFSNSLWFPITNAIWEATPEWTSSLGEAIPFFGDLLALPLYLVCLLLNGIVAIGEAILSLGWLIICFIAIILAMGFTYFLVYVVVPLFSLGLLILFILSMSRGYSIKNRLWSFLCLLVSIVSCYYYFNFMLGLTPIIPFPL